VKSIRHIVKSPVDPRSVNSNKHASIEADRRRIGTHISTHYNNVPEISTNFLSPDHILAQNMFPIDMIGSAATARAAGSRVVDERPVSRTMESSKGDRRMMEGRVRSVIPDTVQTAANNFI
jgi:hypothetical protein